MINRKINVLHLLLSLETGGMERFVYEHCLEIDKSMFNVSVCCIDRLGGFYESLVENGIRVDLLEKNQNHFDWFFPWKLKKYLKEDNINILHIHTGAFFHGSVAGFLAKTPGIIYTEHGRHLVEPKVIYLLDKISSMFTDKIVTVSPDLKKHLINKIKLPAKKIVTIINGVNTKSFIPRDKSINLLKELGIESGYNVIGAVGRLAPIKNQAALIRAFDIVQQKIPKSRLILVGEGPCETELKNLTHELGLVGSVVFAGNRKDIPEILNLFDVFVLPSLLEGTSLSLLEAMASGVPPVVSNVGGNPNIVTEDYNGYLVEPNDFEKMAEKIISILTDAEKAQVFKNNSRNTVLSGFSLETNVELYKKIYIDLLMNNCKEP